MCFWVRVGTWNIGSLGGNGGDVCDELRRNMTVVRGQSAMMLGMDGRRYKLWWSEKDITTHIYV